MSKRLKILLLLAGVVLVVGAYMLLRPETEPTYQGRTLSYWVLRLSPDEPGDSEAAEAVRQIGAKAVPFLLKWMAYERPAWMRSLDRLRYSAFHLQPPKDEKGWRAYGACWAFKFAGPEGKKAIPALCRLLNQPEKRNAAHRAAIALSSLGPESLPPLLLAVTNQAPEIRATCVWAFSLAASNSGPALAAIMQGLSDQDSFVRRTAARALGEIKPDPALVVPALTNAIRDPDPWVRIQAASSLILLGKEAGAAVPVLQQALRNEESLVRVEATNALLKIAPEALTNAMR
jgi:hypothetical protein